MPKSASRVVANEPVTESSVVAEIGRIVGSTLDIQEIYQQFADQVRKLVPFDRITISDFDLSAGTLTPVYVAGLEVSGWEPGQTHPLSESRLGPLAYEGRPLLFDGDSTGAHAHANPETAAGARPGLGSGVAAPIVSSGNVIGALNLSAFDPHAYSESDLALTERVARQISGAIANTRLYREKEASEQRLSKIFDYSNDAIFVIDPESDEILDANPRACRMLGYSREVLLSLPVSTVHPEEMDRLRAFVDSVRRRGHGSTDELTCTTRTGHVLPAEMSASVVEFEGRPCIIAMVRDITERRQAEDTQRELAVLEERNRIARDIHDSIAQGITGIIWQLNLLERTIGGGDAQAVDELKKVRDIARGTLQDARRSVWDLRTGLSHGASLADTLREEGEKIGPDGRLSVTFEVDGNERVLPSGTETALVRIFQEAMANILKHSGAGEVAVALSYDDTRVRLTVSDNGSGFDPDLIAGPRKEAGGFGLIGMRERARLLGGIVRVDSCPGEGTVVEARLPAHGT